MGLFDRFKQAVEPVSNKTVITAPVSGELLQLSETTEPVFSSEMMGKGVAINPSESTIIAPVDGTVTVVMPHAIGIVTDNGIEVLIHVGIDTVDMKGEGFENKVAQDSKVTAGTELLSFSREKVAEAGHDDTVFVIISNTPDCQEVLPVADAPVKAGDSVITVTK